MLRLRSTIARRSAVQCSDASARARRRTRAGPSTPIRRASARANGGAARRLPAGELVRIHVVTVADGLVRPWHLTFLPGGTDYLVTELPGDLRIVRGGKLDPQPVSGLACRRTARSQHELRRAARRISLATVCSIFSYVKQRDGGDTTIALARGHFDGNDARARRRRIRRRCLGYRRDGRTRGARSRRNDLLDRRRSRRGQRHGRRELPHARAGSRQPRGQSAALARRRHGSGRQPVRRPRRRQTRDLHLRSPQRAGARVASRHRRAVGHRDRAHGGRRAQSARSRVATTAGRSCRSAKSTRATLLRSSRGSGPAWRCPRCFGCRRSVPRA